VGWKETLRMNPLEDVYVAVRASHPVTPFGIPASHRVLDPSQTVGSQLMFTQIDPTTGNAPLTQTYINAAGVSGPFAATAYTNQLTDFDNEYVWHCHILGHEEQDFMRPFVFHPTVMVPDAPAAVKLTGSTVTWTDTTPVGGQDAQGIPTAGVNAAYTTPTSSPKNEIGYKIYLAPTLDANGFVTAPALPDAVVPANVTTYTAAAALPATTVVVAYNAAGNSAAGTSGTTTGAGALVGTPAALPPAGTFVLNGATIDSTGLIVTASNTGILVGATVSGTGVVAGTTVATITATGFTLSVAATPAPAPGVTLTVVNQVTVTATVPAASAAPAGFTQTLNAAGQAVLNWTAVPGAISYNLSITETTGAVPPVVTTTVVTLTGTLATATTVPLATTYTTPLALNTGSTYSFSVTATTLAGTTVAATTGLSNSPIVAPVAFAVAADTSTVVGSGSITLSWANAAANKNNVAGLKLTWAGGSKTFAPTTTGTTVIGLTPTTSYTFNLSAVSNVTTVTPAAATAVTAVAP
jgi:hypothetical protein